MNKRILSTIGIVVFVFALVGAMMFLGSWTGNAILSPDENAQPDTADGTSYETASLSDTVDENVNSSAENKTSDTKHSGGSGSGGSAPANKPAENSVFKTWGSVEGPEQLGPELVTCGNFSCNDGWNMTAGVNRTGFRIINQTGIAVYNSIDYPSSGILYQDINASAYKRYKIEMYVDNTWFTWHKFQVEIGDTKDGIFMTPGKKSFYIETVGDGDLKINVTRAYNRSANANVVFSNISVKEVLNYYHENQSDYYNVSDCRTLDTPNSVYTQIADIVSDVTHCIVVQGDNITFNGNGYKISGETIYVSNSENFTVKNANTQNIEITESRYGHVYNTTIQNCSQWCLRLIGSDVTYNLFENLYLNNSAGLGVDLFGIGFGGYPGASNNVFKDITIEGINQSSVNIPSLLGFQTNLNNTFVNCSYDDELVEGSNNQLFRSWYYEAKVENSSGADQPNIFVRIYNSIEGLFSSQQTNSTGDIEKTSVVAYVNNAGVITSYNNHSIEAGYLCSPISYSASYNSSSGNAYHVLTLDSEIHNWKWNLADSCNLSGSIYEAYNITTLGQGQWSIENSTIEATNVEIVLEEESNMMIGPDVRIVGS